MFNSKEHTNSSGNAKREASYRTIMRMDNMPLLKVIFPVVIGIALARLTTTPWEVLAVCFVVTMTMAIALRHSERGGLYVWVSILLLFFMLAELREPQGELPPGERIIVAVQISERPHTKGRWQHTTSDVGYYRMSDSDDWIEANERIILYIDTSFHNMDVGAQLIFRGWFNSVDTTGSGYGNLMRLRGLHGRMYLTQGNLIDRPAEVSRTPAYYAARLQAVAVRKLQRLDMSPNAKAVVTAMTAGDRRAVDNEVSRYYSATGAAHLLSVSGLHVGIVFVLINLFLYLLPVAKRGHIVKNIVAIIAIWVYSVAAGLAPSVIRAALMFSFAQIAFATTSSRNALNIMLGSAIVMLAINPNYATDPSFLLSYVAVLSILLFFSPIYTLLRSRSRLLNALTMAIIIGVVATLGVAPLVSYWFGNFPIVGVIINLPLIFTAYVIVMGGVLWLMMPFGFLQPVFSWVLNVAGSVQNAIVEWGATRSWASASVTLPLWGVFVIYAVYIGVAVWVYAYRARGVKKRVSLMDE